MKLIYMHVLETDKGDIFLQQIDRNTYECYTRSKGYGDLVFQFSCEAWTFEEFLSIVASNFSCGNITWQSDEEA